MISHGIRWRFSGTAVVAERECRARDKKICLQHRSDRIPVERMLRAPIPKHRQIDGLRAVRTTARILTGRQVSQRFFSLELRTLSMMNHG